MIDKRKVKKVINDLLTKEALVGYEQWSSSAQTFDNELRQYGFIPSIEIYHKYKFPDGFDAESFQRYIFQQIYIFLFDSLRIINPELYIKNFYANLSVQKHIQQEYLSDLVKITGSLSDEEKEYVADYFLNEQKQVGARIKSFLPKLKKLNPEINDINPQSIFDFDSLYIGMASLFHMDDIKYFLTLTDRRAANKNLKKLKHIFGTEPGFFMAPERVKQLIDGIRFKDQ